MEFEWDPNKDQGNQEKHGIGFEEAVTVFDDELQITIPDPDHSIGEFRYLTMGWTTSERLVVVSHTEDDDDRIRVISARAATAHERRTYEEGE
ncbi:MAG: BrnT family toxin [Thermoanaerobaculia bacterium]